MRFGVCCSDRTKFEMIKKYGYDYVEMGFSNIVNMSEEDYEKSKAELERLGLKAETFNGFFPADIKLVGEEVDYDVIKDHAEKGMKRAAALGGQIAVIGSGKARTFPEGFDKETAHDQFAKVLDICGTIAENHGMKIVTEPLNTGESNIINTVQEGFDIAARSGNKNVAGLADFFHVFKSGESLSAIENNNGRLLHVHLARANADRRMPVPGVDDEQCKAWAAALKKGGYNSRISLEGSFKPIDSDTADIEKIISEIGPILEIFR